MVADKNKTSFSVCVESDYLGIDVRRLATSHFESPGLDKLIAREIELVFEKITKRYSTGEIDLLSQIHVPEALAEIVSKVTGDEIYIHQLADMLPPTVHPVNKNIIFVVSYYEPVKYKIPLDITVDRVDVKYAKDKGIIRMEYRYKNNNGEADIRVVEHNCRENPDLVVNTNVDVSFITSME